MVSLLKSEQFYMIYICELNTPDMYIIMEVFTKLLEKLGHCRLEILVSYLLSVKDWKNFIALTLF